MLAGMLKFVEIQTKITSVFPFLMVLAYLMATGHPILWDRTLVFFCAMLLIDLSATALNNYLDTRKNGIDLTVARRLGLILLIALLLAGAAFGLLLAYMTDVVVLLVGGACFLCGVLYTFGPVPLSHTPLGELFSGLFYGLAIPFLLLYCNLPEGSLLTLSLSPETVSLQFQIFPLFSLIMLCAAPTCCTANIMLANNICDLESDIQVRRHTLPYYLGRARAVRLYTWLTYGGYLAALPLAALGILPPFYLLTWLAAIPATINLLQFRREQIKARTFSMSIRNYLLQMSSCVVLIFLSRFLR